MKSKQLLNAAVAVLALSPFVAFAGGGDERSKEWLASFKSTRTVEEVRAEAKGALLSGERHPVEVISVNLAEPMRSRAEVKAELAKHGTPRVGA
jgi:hypothetical protein